MRRSEGSRYPPPGKRVQIPSSSRRVRLRSFCASRLNCACRILLRARPPIPERDISLAPAPTNHSPQPSGCAARTDWRSAENIVSNDTEAAGPARADFTSQSRISSEPLRRGSRVVGGRRGLHFGEWREGLGPFQIVHHREILPESGNSSTRSRGAPYRSVNCASPVSRSLRAASICAFTHIGVRRFPAPLLLLRDVQEPLRLAQACWPFSSFRPPTRSRLTGRLRWRTVPGARWRLPQRP